MLWVEKYLRRKSSRAWCEGGLNAQIIKMITYNSGNTRIIGNHFISKELKGMKEFDQLPKALKKLIRYIKQDASMNQLEQFKKVLDYTIEKRMKMLKKILQE